MKSATDLTPVERQVYDYGMRLESGAKKKTRCPFDGCAGRTHKNDPSLSITRDGDTVLYKCHYCHTSDGIASKAFERQPAKPPAPLPAASVRPAEPHAGHAFLAARGIDPVRFADHLAYESHWFNKSKESQPSVVFLYKDGNGKIVYRKWRSLAEKDFSSQGEAKTLFMLDAADQNKDLIITEGELDALALRTFGYNAVSIPAGASSIDWLEACRPLLRTYDRIVFWGDADKQGREYLAKLKQQPVHLLHNFVFVEPDWMDANNPGAKDANDLVLRMLDEPKEKGALDPGDIEKVLASAQPLKLKWLIEANSLTASFTRIRDGVYAQKIGIGEKDLDRIYSPVCGYTTTLTGIPGHGKSTFLNWYISRLAAKYDWKIGIWSPENDPALQYGDLMNICARRPLAATVDKPAMSPEEIIRHQEWVSSHFKIIADYEGDGSVETILEQASTLKAMFGIRGFVVDPWNYVSLPAGSSDTDRVRAAFGKFVAFSRSENLHLWLVAHPVKMQAQWKKWKSGQSEEERAEEDAKEKLKVPKGYDISGSAHFYNMTDVGLTVYREEDGSTKLLNWKSRRKFLGMEGETRMYFDQEDLAFKDTDGMARYIKPGSYGGLDDF